MVAALLGVMSLFSDLKCLSEKINYYIKAIFFLVVVVLENEGVCQAPLRASLGLFLEVTHLQFPNREDHEFEKCLGTCEILSRGKKSTCLIENGSRFSQSHGS